MREGVRKRLNLVDKCGKKPREFAKNKLYVGLAE
jgi:hypothetical protein